MSNTNSILYFVSQSYRQVQLSVEKGTELYTYGDFNKQFQDLLTASNDEDYTKNMTILLVEEAARQKQTTDYLRQEMDFEIKSSATGKLNKPDVYNSISIDTNSSGDLSARRMGRHKN